MPLARQHRQPPASRNGPSAPGAAAGTHDWPRRAERRPLPRNPGLPGARPWFRPNAPDRAAEWPGRPPPTQAWRKTTICGRHPITSCSERPVQSRVARQAHAGKAARSASSAQEFMTECAVGSPLDSLSRWWLLTQTSSDGDRLSSLSQVLLAGVLEFGIVRSVQLCQQAPDVCRANSGC